MRTYVSVDGGMGDNVRPALYGARYTARVANKMDDVHTAGHHRRRTASKAICSSRT